MAGVTSLGEVGGVAILTDDLLVLKHKRCVLQRLVTAGTGKVLRVPHPPHGTGKRPSDWFVATRTHSLTIHHLTRCCTKDGMHECVYLWYN